MKASKALVLTFVILSLMFTACNDSEEADSIYKFTVRSTGNSFYGYYSVDEDENNIKSDDIVYDDEHYYFYEKDLNNPSHVDIYIDGYPEGSTGGATMTIHIRFIENGDCVKETKITKLADDDVIAATLNWDYSEDSGTSD